MRLIIDAFDFAKEKHAGQFRKGTGDDYFTHPVSVSYIVARYKVSKHLEELIAAAYLHDTLEDTDTTFAELADRFGPMVASIVFELTNDEMEIKLVGKKEYQKKKMVGMSSYALILKLADRLHNISDNPTVKMIDDTLEIMKYLLTARKLTKTHAMMVNDIISECYTAKAASVKTVIADYSV